MTGEPFEDRRRNRGGGDVPVARTTVGGDVLAQRVCEALGRLAGSAREVGVGLGVLAELLEEELVDVTGPNGQARS